MITWHLYDMQKAMITCFLWDMCNVMNAWYLYDKQNTQHCLVIIPSPPGRQPGMILSNDL